VSETHVQSSKSRAGHARKDIARFRQDVSGHETSRELSEKCSSLLDAIAEEHSLGHQESKAGRYIIVSRHGIPVEIMFEKNEEAPPNIWCLERAAGSALIAAQDPRHSRTDDLRTKLGKDGQVLYGRHSALEQMKQLGEEDLVCFTPKTLGEFGQIIDRLRSVTTAETS
jgi:hypothetical protein